MKAPALVGLLLLAVVSLGANRRLGNVGVPRKIREVGRAMSGMALPLFPVTALAIHAALSGCAQIGAQVEQHKDDALITSGFTPVPANTPQRQAALASMPPHTFIHEMRNGRMLYAYADPTVCDCVYIGDQAAYQRYRAKMSLQELANEQQTTDEMYHMNWDSWGPGWQ